MPQVGPELAVRLSAVGVQDIVNAFKRARQEASTTKDSLNLLNKQMESLSNVLPAVSLGSAIAGVGAAIYTVTQKAASLIESARATGEEIGKMSQKTGGAVGTLSALHLATIESELDFDVLGKGIIKLAKSQDAAIDGSQEQVRAFKSLGIGISELNKTNPADLFVKVAQKMAAIPAGAQRTATALKLFGKAGADLLPTIDSLGGDSFDRFLDKAKKTGQYLDPDLVNSMMAAQQAVHSLEESALGLATQFDAGFMPRAARGIQDFADTVEGRGITSVKKFGDTLGKVFQYLVDSTALYTIAFRGMFKEIEEYWSFYSGAVKALASSGITGAAVYLSQNSAGHDQRKTAIATQTVSDILDLSRESLSKLPDDQSQKKRQMERDLSQQQLEQQARLQKSLSDLLQARADNELAILKAMGAAEDAQDKRRYDAGLMSLDEYFDARKKRINEQADAEESALEQKLAAAQKLPQQNEEQRNAREKQIEQIQTQQFQLGYKRVTDLAAIEQERAQARTDQAQKQLADEQKLASMTGDRVGAAKLALQQEINDYSLLLQKQGKSGDEIERAVALYRQRGEASIAFMQSVQQGNSGLNALGYGTQAIQSAQGAGAISQISATAQLVKLQQEQLPTLRQIGLEMLKQAALSENTDQIQQAVAFNKQLDEMQTKLGTVKSAATEFVDVFTTTGMSAFTDFFSDIASGTKSAGDAFEDLATTFEKAIGQMISQLFVFYALSALVGWIAPDSSLATSLKASGPFGKITGYDEGGWTGGKRGQVTGVVHGEEFVVKAGPAAANRPMLEALNAGLSPAAVMTRGDYATPMPTASAAAVDASSLAPVINITTPPGTQASTSQRTGQNGQSITDIIITTVASDIARGGKIAQTQQSAFGLTRRGTKR